MLDKQARQVYTLISEVPPARQSFVGGASSDRPAIVSDKGFLKPTGNTSQEVATYLRSLCAFSAAYSQGRAAERARLAFQAMYSSLKQLPLRDT